MRTYHARTPHPADPRPQPVVGRLQTIRPVVVFLQACYGTEDAKQEGRDGDFAGPPPASTGGRKSRHAMSKAEKKQQKAELGTMAGMVRMAEAAADRAEQRATKAAAEATGARAFAAGLRKQAEEAHAAAVLDAQARHGK